MDYFLKDDLPEGFTYPDEFKTIIEQRLINLSPWKILGGDLLTIRFTGIRTRYPLRKVIPFAQRNDNDDIACFDVNKKGAIIIIHDYASPGWEERRTFNSFWDWFKQAVNDMIEHNL